MLYQDTLTQYFKSLKRRNCSPHTLNNYRQCLYKLGDHLGRVELEQIQLSHLREWIDLAVTRRPSSYTIWTKVVIARAFFNWCVQEGLLLASPARRLDKPRLPKHLPKALTDQEILALFQATEKSCSPERDKALVFFLLETGARRGAVASLTTVNLHLEEGMARVVTKGNKEIELFFGKITREVLRVWLKIRNPRNFRPSVDPQSVFGLTSDGVRQVLSRLTGLSGIQHSVSPHVLRHTSATLRVEQDIDSSSLQQIMGWEDIRMAEVYTRLAHERLKRRAIETSPMNKIFPLGS